MLAACHAEDASSRGTAVLNSASQFFRPCATTSHGPKSGDTSTYATESRLNREWKTKLKDSMAPTSPPDRSCTCNRHVPAVSLELKAASASSGQKTPENGAEADPSQMPMEAESSNVVLVKLSPVPPLWLLRITCVLSGPINVSTSCPVAVC